MKLYHGSNTGGIKVLKPRQADHDRPYVYLTTIKVVAAFYLCNAVQRPYYWFPYGFTQNNIPIYHELYPNALREVSEGVTGILYEVEAEEEDVLPFKNIPCARLGTKPLTVTGYQEVKDAYELFEHLICNGKLCIGKYEDKPERERQKWYDMILDYIREKELNKKPDCSYAKFVQEKFPWVWEKYLYGEKSLL